MLKIKNYDQTLNSEYIMKIIELLPKKYKELNLEIIIPKNKYLSLIMKDFWEYRYSFKYIFSGFTYGSSSHYSNRIYIYYFNFDCKYSYLSKLRLIATIFHEVKHQWQKINNTTNFKQYNINDDYKNKLDYNKWKHEIEANNFSKQIILNNKYEISCFLQCNIELITRLVNCL